MLEFFVDNIFLMSLGTNCTSSRQLVHLFVRGRLHTGASQEKRKETSLIL